MAMTNKTVLKHVEPLLKDRNGRGYRRRGNQSENNLVYNCCINVNLLSNIYISENAIKSLEPFDFNKIFGDLEKYFIQKKSSKQNIA